MPHRMLVLGLVALLPGCTTVSSVSFLAANAVRWLAPSAAAPNEGPGGASALAQAPLYCYSTLGDPDCHASKLTDAGPGRLIGHVGPSASAP